MDLQQELWETYELLKKATAELKQRGIEYHKAQRNYRVKLAKKELELRTENYPATLISDLARGNEEVADAKLQEGITKTLYESCQEGINVYKYGLKILQEQINKEYEG